MKTLNLSELPPLVYQLLVLSNKGHKALVLQGIQALFNELDQEMLKNKEQHADGYTPYEL
jgi:Fanconi anemia group I protein